MKKFSFLLMVVSLVGFLIGCNNTSSGTENNKTEEVDSNLQLIEDKDNQIKEVEKQIEELQNTVETLELDLKYSNEEADFYNQLVLDMIKDYSEEESLNFSKGLWDYNLMVNQQPVPEDGVIEVQENTIEISLSQEQPAWTVLPNDLLMKGKISGDYIEHILSTEPSPSETFGTDGTVITGMHYKFVDIENGGTVSFTITEELKTRLGLTTSEITIVNK